MVRALAEALRQELRSQYSRIRVTVSWLYLLLLQSSALDFKLDHLVAFNPTSVTRLNKGSSFQFIQM